MKEIKVLGSGCSKCKITARMIQEVARDKGVSIKLQRVEDVSEIMAYGLMSTPGIVVDGKLVHAGSVPERVQVQQWLSDDCSLS